MATHKSAKSLRHSNARKHTDSKVPTPWLKLKKMWEDGASYQAMARATDAHYDPKKPDPTKATRAKIWKARNVGVKVEGKLVKFKARGKQPAGKHPKTKEKPGRKPKPGKRVGTPTSSTRTAKHTPATESQPVPSGHPELA